MKDKYTYFIPLLCILLAIIAITIGCTTNIISPYPEGKGVTDLTPREDLERVKLGDALSSFEVLNRDQITTASPAVIHYIRGESIDKNGSALAWIIGASMDQNNFFYVYSAYRQQLTNYSDELPFQIVRTESLLSPENLFKQRPLLIDDITDGGEREILSLEIRDGKYVMTVRKENTTKSYFFNSTTGVELHQE